MLATACVLLPTACVHTTPADLAIRGATVVDVIDGSLRSDQIVLIKDKRIVAVGPTALVKAPRNVNVVEMQGCYLIPGMWDMHVHSVANVTVDRSNQSVAAQDWHFPLFLAHGITGVRNMNDGTGDVHLELTNSVRLRLTRGDLVGPPRFLTAGPSIDGDPPLGSNSFVVRTAEQARSAVEQLAANGADLVKVYENISREAYFAILDEADFEEFASTATCRSASHLGGRRRWPAHGRASGRPRGGLRDRC
jgi:imidazolonepropionase-like amidohydrolase